MKVKIKIPEPKTVEAYDLIASILKGRGEPYPIAKEIDVDLANIRNPKVKAQLEAIKTQRQLMSIHWSDDVYREIDWSDWR